MKTETITIIGLGQRGASIGLALQEAQPDLTLLGYDKEDDVGRQAQKMGAVDKAEWNLIKAAAPADILILTLPAAALRETLRLIGQEVQPHAIVLDLAGLKSQGAAWAEQYLAQGHYVGARPILSAAALVDGRAFSGAARADLFQDSLFCLTATPDVDPQAVQTAVSLGRILGAAPFFLEPEEYDRLSMAIETLPALLAAALFQAVTGADGWRDILRLAGPAFALATQPLNQIDAPEAALQQPEAALRWLDALAAGIETIRQQIGQGERERLKATFEEMNRQREAWLEQRRQNDWQERPEREIPRVSWSEQLLGSLARRSEER